MVLGVENFIVDGKYEHHDAEGVFVFNITELKIYTYT